MISKHDFWLATYNPFFWTCLYELNRSGCLAIILSTLRMEAARFVELSCQLQGESLARGPKLLSIKNYVLEIMAWKFIYTYRERCKTGPAHNRCWNWSPFTSKHTGLRFSKFWNTFPKVSTLAVWISWRIASLIVRGVFLYTLPFNRPQRKKSPGVRSASPCL